MIRELKEEIEKLRAGGATIGSGGGGDDSELKAKMEEQQRMMDEMEAEN